MASRGLAFDHEGACAGKLISPDVAG